MSTYKRILKYVIPYWKRLILIFILSVLYAVLNGLSIYLVIPLLDTLFQEGKTVEQSATTQQIEKTSSLLPDFINEAKDSVSEWFTSFVYTGDKIDILLKICFIILFVFFLKNLFGYLQANLMSYVEYSSMNDLRDEAYKHLHKLPIGYFKKEKVGNLISRFTNDVTKIQESVSATFSNLIKEPLTILVFLLIALSISWQLTLFAIVILPLSMLVILWIGLKVRKQSSIVQAKIADITSVLQETISGVKVVKAFGMEKYENKKFVTETGNFLKEMLRIVRIRNATSPLTEMISLLVGVIIIYYGGTLVLQSSVLSASLFMGFLLAILQMMRPIKELSTVNTRIQEAGAAADRVFEILDTVPDIKDSEKAKSLKSFNETISFKDVSFRYEDSEDWVLDKINFTVRKGDIIALVGPSGGGKSTLVDLLPRFYDPAAGSIMIDNEDIRSYTIDSLRSKMGIVTQETFLFNTSIRQNIAYGLEEHPMEEIVDAAKAANAHEFIIQTPNSYETVIGERGVKLSGGQRQRLTIARAILKNPDIMIFDEAIERMMKNRTTFVIAHRLSTIRNASRILVIEKGKIVQSGTHQELMLIESGLYKKLYEMQFRDSD